MLSFFPLASYLQRLTNTTHGIQAHRIHRNAIIQLIECLFQYYFFVFVVRLYPMLRSNITAMCLNWLSIWCSRNIKRITTYQHKDTVKRPWHCNASNFCMCRFCSVFHFFHFAPKDSQQLQHRMRLRRQRKGERKGGREREEEREWVRERGLESYLKDLQLIANRKSIVRSIIHFMCVFCCLLRYFPTSVSSISVAKVCSCLW